MLEQSQYECARYPVVLYEDVKEKGNRFPRAHYSGLEISETYETYILDSFKTLF